jgi:hypothetical protein
MSSPALLSSNSDTRRRSVSLPPPVSPQNTPSTLFDDAQPAESPTPPAPAAEAARPLRVPGRAPSGIAPSPSGSAIAASAHGGARRRRVKHSNNANNSATNADDAETSTSSVISSSAGSGIKGQLSTTRQKKKQREQSVASAGEAAPRVQLTVSDVDFFTSLASVSDGVAEPSSLLLSPSDATLFQAVRELKNAAVAGGRMSIHIAGVEGLWPVAGGTIGGLMLPARPEMVRVVVRVVGLSDLATPIGDPARQITAIVRLVTTDSSLATEWASPRNANDSVPSDEHRIAAAAGSSHNSTAATPLASVAPPHESSTLLSKTHSLEITSLQDEVAITVLDAQSGALLGQHSTPIARLAMLREHPIRVALGVRSAQRDAPRRRSSGGGAALGTDVDDDSEAREQQPSLVLSLLALNFGLEREAAVYAPAFSGGEFNSSGHVIVEGLLQRRCGRRWRERYVRLDEENLYIFKAADDRDVPEVLPLALASVKETTSSSAEKKATHAYRFEIWNSNHDRHEFCTNSVQVIKKWMAALETVCATLLERQLDQAATPASPRGDRTVLDCVLLEARDLAAHLSWKGLAKSPPSRGYESPEIHSVPQSPGVLHRSNGAELAIKASDKPLRQFSLSADLSQAASPVGSSAAGSAGSATGGSVAMSSSSALPRINALARSPPKRMASVYAVLTCCGQQCRTSTAPSFNPQWSRGDGSERDRTLGTSVNCSFVVPSEPNRTARSVVNIELFDDLLSVPLGSTQVAIDDVRGDEQRWSGGVWLPLYLPGSPTANGVVRVRLQLNSKHSGMLVRYGYPLITMPLRAHSGDLVLFTPDSTGARVVRMMTMCKWVHVGMVVMGHNDKLKLLEATAAGVTLRVLDTQLGAYHRAGSVVGLRRLCGVARTATVIDALIEFVDQVEGTPYETKYTQMLKAQKRANKEVDLDAVFCSELVAAAFMRLGLLQSRDMSASNFMPKDFATDVTFNAANGSVPSLASIVECRASGVCSYGGDRARGALTPRIGSPVMSPRREEPDDLPPLSAASSARSEAAIASGTAVSVASGEPHLRRLADMASDTALLRSGSGKMRKIVLQGELLMKQSRNRWRSRWLKLTNDNLFVFKAASSRSNALDVFPLTFASVKETAPEVHGKTTRFHFELFSGLRHELFATENAAVFRKWMKEIQSVCNALLQGQLDRLSDTKSLVATSRWKASAASNDGPGPEFYASAMGHDDSDDSDELTFGIDGTTEQSVESSDESSESSDGGDIVKPIAVRAPMGTLGGSGDDDDSVSPAPTRPVGDRVSRIVSTGTGFSSAHSSEKYPSASSEPSLRASERFPSVTSLFNEGSSTDSTDNLSSIEARVMRAHREEIRKSSALLDAELKLLNVTLSDDKAANVYFSELDALLLQKLRSVQELRELIQQAAASGAAASSIVKNDNKEQQQQHQQQ